MSSQSFPLSASKLKALENFFALESFHLPKVTSRLPVRWHPQFLSLDREADEWMFNRMGITDTHVRKKDLVHWRIPLFNNMVIPCGEYQKSLVCSKYTWAITMLDDPLDDEEKTGLEAVEYLDSLMSIARGTKSLDQVPAAKDPAMRAWEEVIAEMRRLMPPPVFGRFLVAHELWAAAFVQFQQSESITAETYIPFRRVNIGYDPWLPMLEFCLNVCMDEEDLECADYLAARTALIDHVWLVNDLYSVGKDFRFKKLRNLQFVLLATDPNVQSFQDATNKLCSMIQDKEEEYIYYHKLVVARANESSNVDFVKYMEGLQGMIHSNLLYHSLTSRYHGTENPDMTGDVFHGTWLLKEHPKRTVMFEKNGAGVYSNLLAI